jgi:hypothetical protein
VARLRLVTIVLRTRSTSARRCAWCHDAEAGANGSRCGGCRTWLHVACWSEAGQACPTRGCPEQRRAVAAAQSNRATDWLLPVSVTFLIVFVLLAGAIAKFNDALEDRGGPYTTKIDADIVAKINAGGAGQ